MQWRWFRFLLLAICTSSNVGWNAAKAVELAELLGRLEFSGEIVRSKDVSALAVVGDLLVLGSDEGAAVQILKRDGHQYRVIHNQALRGDDEEIDIEGIAAERDIVYVIGSHSRRRLQIDDEAIVDATTEAGGRQHIGPIERQTSRERLYRFRLSTDGRISALSSTSLMPLLERDPVLRPFAQIPAKENGIDIEGIAARDGTLYLGFRGPVLRGNLTPILECRFGDPVTDAEWLFVDLAGRGVRDLVRVNDGFLILAGQVSDQPGPYLVYAWDGTDCFQPTAAGIDRKANRRRLAEIPAPGKDKAEGLTVLREDESSYELLVVYDGAKNGGSTRFRVLKMGHE